MVSLPKKKELTFLIFAKLEQINVAIYFLNIYIYWKMFSNLAILSHFMNYPLPNDRFSIKNMWLSWMIICLFDWITNLVFYVIKGSGDRVFVISVLKKMRVAGNVEIAKYQLQFLYNFTGKLQRKSHVWLGLKKDQQAKL